MGPRKPSSYQLHSAYEPSNGPAPPERPSEKGAQRAAGPSRHLNSKEQFEKLLDLLSRRKRIVVAGFLAVLIGTAVYAFAFVPEPVYEADSFVLLNLVEWSEEPPDAYSENAPFASSNRPLLDELVLLRLSHPLAKRVLERLQSQRVLPGSATPLPILHSEEGRPLSEQGVISRLRGSVAFAPEPGSSNIVRIKASSTAPAEAALLANVYAEEYVRLTQETVRARLSGAQAFLEEQISRRREELQHAEEAYQAYLEEAGTVDLDQESLDLVSEVASLEAQRDEARIELQALQTSMQSLAHELESVGPRVAEGTASGLDERIKALKEEIVQLDAVRRQARIRYPASERSEQITSELQRLDEKVQQLQQEVIRLSQSYVAMGVPPGVDGLNYMTNLRQQAAEERKAFDRLSARVEMLERRLEEARSALHGIPRQSLDLAQLERSRMYAERMHQFVVERMIEVRLVGEVEQGAAGYVHVVREAVKPTAPVRPDTKRILILGALFGLLVGLSLAVAVDKLDYRIYKPDQLRELGYDAIGVVPDLRPMLKKHHGRETSVERNGHRFATTLVSLLHPMSAAVEAYRHLRTGIQFSLPDAVVRTLLVTSSNAQEGKSVTAANLAVIMAQAKRRTLLIDADLRRPRTHQLLGVPSGPGLVDLISREVRFDVEQAKTGVDDLYVIAAGRPVPNSAELLGSEGMRALLEELRGQFDVVVIDTPPVLAATDAALLSAQCDATVIVARAGRTKEKELEHTAEMLENVGATLIGVVLNGFDISMAYGYTYRYGYYSAYGPHAEYGYYVHGGAEASEKPWWKRLGEG